MFKAGLLSLALFAGAVPASAQDASWEERFGKALDLEQDETSLAMFKELEQSAATKYDRASALYRISVNYAYLGQHGQSRVFLEQAREAYLAQDVQDDFLYDIIAKDLIGNYIKFGMQIEAEDLAEERRIKLMPTDPNFWSLDGDEPVHRQSGATCPLVAGDFLREDMLDFNPMGDDFVCKYVKQIEPYNLVSIYMSRYDETYSSKEAHAENLTLVDTTIDRLGASYGVKSKKIRHAFHGEPLYMSRYSYQDNEGNTKQSGLWTAVAGNWIFKSRVTWDSSLGENFGQEATEEILNSTTANALAHATKCKEFDASDFPKLESELDLDDSVASGMMALLSISLARQAEEKIEDDDLKVTLFDSNFDRPPTECSGHYASREGNLFINSHYDSERIYTLSGKAIEADTFLSKPYGMGTGSYMLQSVKRLNSDDGYQHKIYKVYEEVPNPEQVFVDYTRIFNGDLKSLGHVDLMDSGDSNVNIYTED